MGILLRGGSVIDGSGAEPRRADIRIDADVVTALGEIEPAHDDEVIDVSEGLVMPGFIDAHVHAAPAMGPDASEVHLALLAQGITTVVLGQDGMGFAPGRRAAVAYAADYFGGIDGPPPAGLVGGATVGELLDTYDGAAPINAAYLVPAGLVRYDVMTDPGSEPTPAELERMVDAVGKGLRDGAVGMSTGLEYLPGRHAATEELIALCRPLAELGAVHVSHMRGYEARVEVGGREMLEVAAATGVRTHLSHLKGAADRVEGLLRRGEDAGLDVTFDAYPYQQGSTLLAMKALPDDFQAGGPAATLARLDDPAEARRLAASWPEALVDELSAYTLAGSLGPAFQADEGLPIGEAATRRRQEIRDYVIDVLADSRLWVTCVIPSRMSGSADISRLATHPAYMASSDGIYVGRHPHPRGWGAFARLLREHVRERRDWSWGQAGWFLSGHAAHRFGLEDRGCVAVGAAADLVVVDPTAVTDEASFDEPRRPASGIDMVVVNGARVYAAGRLTNACAGRALRRRPH
jgi:N-acyl-D-amino-acid deacylase